MSTGGSRVENFHGWATCGQLVTGGAHVDGRDFPWDWLTNQKPPYKIIWCTCGFMWRTWVQNHIIAHIIHMSPCVHMAFMRDYRVVTWFFMCFTCAILETRNLWFASTWLPPVITMWPHVTRNSYFASTWLPPVITMWLRVLCMWRDFCNSFPHDFRPQLPCVFCVLCMCFACDETFVICIPVWQHGFCVWMSVLYMWK